MATDANGGIVAAWLSGCRIRASVTSRGQAWGRPAELATIPQNVSPTWIREPTLAANAGGMALVAWAAQDRTAGRQLFSTRYRPPAWLVVQRFDGGEAQQLASPYAASLALDSAGSGLAVWDSEGVVAARRSATDQWQAPERLAARPSSPPRVFLDTAGRGFATWSEAGEAFAQRFEPDRGWSETTGFTPDAGWSFVGSGEVAFDASGQALLVWQRDLGATQQLVSSSAGAGPPALAVSAGGNAVVAWQETDGATGRGRIWATRYASARPFRLSEFERLVAASAPQVRPVRPTALDASV